MKVLFTSDFFDTEIVGGAEKNDAVLVKYLQESGIDVESVHTYHIDPRLEEADFIIVSNFIRLSTHAKRYLMAKGNYLIYEHDHKYVRNRNPAAYSGYRIPESQLINVPFYQNAKHVVVLSTLCKKVMEENLDLTNIHNISCSLWSQESLQLLRKIQPTEKRHKYAIMDSSNPVKGKRQALQYCEQKSITAYSIPPTHVYEDFLNNLAECENLIFFPQVLETFSRLCAEAKMMECGVMTIAPMVGFFSEDFSHLKGEALIDKISSNVEDALLNFKDMVTS